jgi:hypothetical protein
VSGWKRKCNKLVFQDIVVTCFIPFQIQELVARGDDRRLPYLKHFI